MSAGGNTAQIELGPGRLWYAPLGTTEPTSASAAMPSAWQAIGYTEDGSTTTIELSAEEIEVEEELDPVLYVNVKRATSLSLEMAQPTRKRLALALGAGATALDSAEAFEPPDAGDEVAIMLVWDSEENADGNDQNIRWLYRQAKPTGTIEISRKKAPDKSLLPVEFNIEKPSNAKSFKVFPNAQGQI